LEQRTILSHDAQADIEQLQKDEKELLARVSAATDERNGVGFELDELLATRKEQREALEDKYHKSLQALDPLVATLHQKIDELKADIERQQELYAKETTASAEYAEKIEASNKAIALLEKDKLKKRAACQTAMGEPERLKTNITLIESVARDLEEEAAKLAEDIRAKEGELAQAQEGRRRTNADIEELGVKLENFRLAIAKRKSNLDDFKRAREIEEQKRDLTLERIKSNEAGRKEAKESLRNYLQSATEFHKAVETQKKLYEKLRRKRDTVASIQKPLLAQLSLGERQLEEMEFQYRNQKSMLHEIKQDEELFISQYLNQEKLEEDTTDLLVQTAAQQKEYEEKIRVLDKEERDLQHAIGTLSAQRELMAREASKATSLYRSTKEDLKVRNLILMDLDKQTIESFARLKLCSHKYDKMKNERNKLANLTQASAQALAEMKEKMKILHNEVDILRSESLAKDKASAEETRLHLAAQNTRDALRVQQNKFIADLRVRREEESQQMMEIIKLNNIINTAEQQMMSLRKDYAHAVDNRNLTGIQLIDRNDELCILYEKHNIQANILRNGDEQLAKLDEEIRAMQRDMAESKRRIEAARRKIPSLDTYAATMRQLQQLEADLDKEKAIAADLCDKLESPQAAQEAAPTPTVAAQAQGMAASLRSDADSKEQPSASAAGDGTSALGVVSSSTSHGPGRSRLLKGMDPEPEQLAAKIEVLEERLNDKKEQLLEKELVLDEVSSLSDKLRMQAAETRGSTLDLAKKVNEIRSKIRHTTRKMMACVSELSMYQASAMRLEGEKGTKEAALAAARERAAQEQPPTDDCEHEWVRMERDRARKQEALLAGAQRVAEMHEDDYSALSLAGRSTAEARPNAYIPSELGIPKPYGALAPFKPSVVGANIRHIRAPKTQEIQL
jgi:chromosome segregation ATPase